MLRDVMSTARNKRGTLRVFSFYRMTSASSLCQTASRELFLLPRPEEGEKEGAGEGEEEEEEKEIEEENFGRRP